MILLILGDPGAVYKGGTISPFVLPLDLRGGLPVRTLPKAKMRYSYQVMVPYILSVVQHPP